MRNWPSAGRVRKGKVGWLLFLAVAVGCTSEEIGPGNTGGGPAAGGSEPTGGAATGGMRTGGTRAGGMRTGGARTGGAATGGQTTGGSNAGGAAGSCAQYDCVPATVPNTGDIYADCVARINQYRECMCMTPLARWTDGEACANQMAEYDYTQNTAHAGFNDGICSGGSAQNECPGWQSNSQVISQCLQQMFNEGPAPSPCTGTCFNTYGHFINMTNTRYTKVACGFYTGPNGKVWALQNFSR